MFAGIDKISAHGKFTPCRNELGWKLGLPLGRFSGYTFDIISYKFGLSSPEILKGAPEGNPIGTPALSQLMTPKFPQSGTQDPPYDPPPLESPRGGLKNLAGKRKTSLHSEMQQRNVAM